MYVVICLFENSLFEVLAGLKPRLCYTWYYILYRRAVKSGKRKTVVYWY